MSCCAFFLRFLLTLFFSKPGKEKNKKLPGLISFELDDTLYSQYLFEPNSEEICASI